MEHLDDALPAALAALQIEHDKLEAELKEEQVIVQEIESCDKAELEEFLAELEAQKYLCISGPWLCLDLLPYFLVPK